MDTNTTIATRPVVILMVEDNPTDVLIAKEGLLSAKMLSTVHVADDGMYAMDFLHRKGKYANAPRPDLILLDLNMPRMDGREVLSEITKDEHLRHLPVVILTSSQDDQEILEMYQLRCSSYIVKPLDFQELIRFMQSFADYWLTVVVLPSPTKAVVRT